MSRRYQYKQPWWEIPPEQRNDDSDDNLLYHPPPPTEVVLYKPYLKATGNQITVALLLDYFYYYCTWMSKSHGSGWITLSREDIKEDFNGALSVGAIGKALDRLVELNLLHRRSDPNAPMNRSRQYLVNFEALQALKEHL